MTNPLIGRTTTPAEREAGCFLSYSFKNNQDVVLDGGTIIGTPSIDNGVTLNGTTDFIKYNSIGEFDDKALLGFHLEFSPAFTADSGSQHRIYQAIAGAGTLYSVLKRSANDLRISAGAGTIVDIPLGTYQPLWRVNGRNLLTGSLTSGNNNAWLNGVQVVSGNATAWIPEIPTILAIGATSTGGDLWRGSIATVKFYGSLLTETDHRNLWLSGDY